jgi:hypothetical protein
VTSGQLLSDAVDDYLVALSVGQASPTFVAYRSDLHAQASGPMPA